MSSLLSKNELTSQQSLTELRQEVEALEGELRTVKAELAAFETKIRAQLDHEIGQLQVLHERYKCHKQEKKARRREQKRRGKNWVEPKQLLKAEKSTEVGAGSATPEQAELKRLYRESIVQVHPDKIAHAGEAHRLDRAHALTVQLNKIYQRGDLEELITFYQQLTLSPANRAALAPEAKLPDASLRLEGLKKKKTALLQQLEQLKGTRIYQVLSTYQNPHTFIDELHHYFLERIRVMEKRTRKL